MAVEVRIPDIGDIDQVEVIEICVSVGDTVSPEDALIVIESDKASMEVPVGVAGVLEAITVKVGDQVKEGQLIARVLSSVAATEKQTEAQGIDSAAPVAADAPVQSEAMTANRAMSAVDDSSADGTLEAGRSVEIRVPEIGDAAGVVVIEVAVQIGDSVGADDLLVVVESDKASMEIPAGAAGVVTQVHVVVGAEVEEGTLLATLRVNGSAPAPTVDARATTAPMSETSAKPESQLVGSGAITLPETPAIPDTSSRSVYAGPAVRRLARELGVNLTEVDGSGNRGRIVKDDVKKFVKQSMTAKSGTQSGPAMGTGIPRIPVVDFSKFGPVRIETLSRIRAVGAANLHRSWLNLPHVTHFDEADITDLEAFRRSLKSEAEHRGIKLTPLAFIIKACCHALKIHPFFNASLDLEAGSFILKDYFHIGIAVDTSEGLVVPVLRDADSLGLWDLSQAIVDLSEKARNRKLGLTDMQGGTFSVSSLGAIGGNGFTPIINAPEVAILGVSKLATKPVWEGNNFVPRGMLPLSLSYDHRAINGAEAGRFMATLTEVLGDIRRLAL